MGVARACSTGPGNCRWAANHPKGDRDGGQRSWGRARGQTRPAGERLACGLALSRFLATGSLVVATAASLVAPVLALAWGSLALESRPAQGQGGEAALRGCNRHASQTDPGTQRQGRQASRSTAAAKSSAGG